MIVISDAPPLRYLILIDLEALLPRLYGQVILPEGVANELQHERTPEKVRGWMAHPPAWLQVERVPTVDPTLHKKLGRGEREAITLAAQYGAALLLTDDAKALKAAGERGVRGVGTLGILEAAAEHEWVTIPPALERLRRETNFRGTPDLFEAVLARDRERQQRRSLEKERDGER